MKKQLRAKRVFSMRKTQKQQARRPLDQDGAQDHLYPNLDHDTSIKEHSMNNRDQNIERASGGNHIIPSWDPSHNAITGNNDETNRSADISHLGQQDIEGEVHGMEEKNDQNPIGESHRQSVELAGGLSVPPTQSIHQSEAQRNAGEYIQQLVNGNPALPRSFAEYGEYAGVVEALDFAYRHGGIEKPREALAAMCRKDDSLLALVQTETPTDTPSSTRDLSAGTEYPALPAGIMPDVQDENAGTWLNTYIDYASAKSPMTPRLFHESAGLVLASIAIARRLVLPLPFDEIYPNLFVVWIAGTTVFHKSTALNIPRKLASRIFPHLIAPQESSPEALLSDMAGVQPSNFSEGSHNPETFKAWQEGRNFAAQKGMTLDEMSGLMARSRKDYNAGLLEILMKLYDCESQYQRSTMGKGPIEVRNSYLTLIGASTPSALWPYLRNPQLWSNGWWPRFALLTPETEKPEWKSTLDSVEEPAILLEGLQHLYKRLPATVWPKSPSALTVTLAPGVMEAWARYGQAVGFDLIGDELDERLAGTYGRMPTQVLKIAMLLAAMDWPANSPAPQIELPHLARAMRIAESWRVSAHRTIDRAARSIYNQNRIRVLNVLARHEPDGATLRELMRSIKNLDPKDLNDVLMQMKMAGEIEEVRNTTGRPTIRFRLIKN